MLRLLVVLTMLQDELKFPVVVRGLITLGCILFVTFPQLPDEFIMVAIVLPLLDLDVSDPSESITKMKVIKMFVFLITFTKLYVMIHDLNMN